MAKGQIKPILPALAVDAACSGNPGLLEFRGVIADTGTEVFRRGPFRQGTNNIGEFLALENLELLEMVRKGELWLRQNTWTTPILKWETTQWGEIPADFGRK